MTITQIIGLVVVLVLAALGGFFIIRKSKKHDLAKWITLFIFVSLALTWVFSYGYYNGTEFIDYGMNQQGITDIPNLLYYSINFAGDKIIFLLALGAFYAVLSKCNGYKKLVVTIAEKLKGKEITFALAASLLFAAMASLFSQSFIALIFVPFVVSIILSMKLDKLTAFCVTFGSILIGTLGVTYGGEGLYWFNYYTQTTVATGMIYRLIILVVSFILFNFFTVLHAKKVLNGKKVNESEVDPFKVEHVDKKAKTWPIIILFSTLFILIVLGYISWEANFGITCFSKFHEWLMELKIGGFAVFKVILGTLSTKVTNGAFGYWNLFHMSIILIIISIVAALVSRIKLDDFIESYGVGFKKIGKGLLLFIGTYMVMVAAYMSPFIPTITNTIFKSIETFNPFLVTLDALLANTFHVDFGFTGYVVATYFTSTFGTNLEVIHTIFTTMYGFVGLCIPTSAILLIGLSYLDIDYKTWMKYIWMFVVAILVILLLLFTIMTYL
ncbi:MAG: hypothetical protein E7161_03555 [Firmicutes bacterium]|nr:hypothetical protein [Bacillota bacterium]